jgi:hypothetical protein
VGLQGFLNNIPDGEEGYFEGVRRMYTYLYQQGLVEGRQIFLDKTPRYYLILPELARTFPEAKFIILLRNPLAVLLSTIHWKRGRRAGLSRHRQDLLEGPGLLVDGLAALKEKALCVNYEELVTSPDKEFQRLCDWLGISFVPEMLNYSRTKWSPEERRGGDVKIYMHQRPNADSIHAWRKALGDPQFWRAAQDYLELLGPDLISRMGYDSGELVQILAESKPRSLRATTSLHNLLTPEDRYVWLERLLNSLRSRGMRETLRSLLRNGHL